MAENTEQKPIEQLEEYILNWYAQTFCADQVRKYEGTNTEMASYFRDLAKDIIERNPRACYLAIRSAINSLNSREKELLNTNRTQIEKQPA